MGNVVLTHLLLGEFLLDLVTMATVVDDGPGELRLHVGQPAAQRAHVPVQTLDGAQRLLQLPHPGATNTQRSRGHEVTRS